jgi:hypothetical protein
MWVMYSFCLVGLNSKEDTEKGKVCGCMGLGRFILRGKRRHCFGWLRTFQALQLHLLVPEYSWHIKMFANTAAAFQATEVLGH